LQCIQLGAIGKVHLSFRFILYRGTVPGVGAESSLARWYSAGLFRLWQSIGCVLKAKNSLIQTAICIEYEGTKGNVTTAGYAVSSLIFQYKYLCQLSRVNIGARGQCPVWAHCIIYRHH